MLHIHTHATLYAILYTCIYIKYKFLLHNIPLQYSNFWNIQYFQCSSYMLFTLI